MDLNANVPAGQTSDDSCIQLIKTLMKTVRPDFVVLTGDILDGLPHPSPLPSLPQQHSILNSAFMPPQDAGSGHGAEMGPMRPRRRRWRPGWARWWRRWAGRRGPTCRGTTTTKRRRGPAPRSAASPSRSPAACRSAAAAAAAAPIPLLPQAR